jgi:acetyltransferase-like isoleucine patch superfamily enzyme
MVSTTTKERFGTGWRKGDVFLTYFYLLPFILRGLWLRLFMGHSAGKVLIGRGVRLAYSSRLHAGRDLIIEDGAEVNCLARDSIKLGNRVTIGKYATIRPANLYGGAIGAGLVVGDHSNIGPYAYIGCSGPIQIGSNVMISPRVSIYAENHVIAGVDIPMKEQGVTQKGVVIEDDCWIAANSVILDGVRIGRGSVVAAGAVVSRDVPPYTVVAGVPAKVIKNRINNKS